MIFFISIFLGGFREVIFGRKAILVVSHQIWHMVYSIPSAWSNKKSFTSSAYGRWNGCNTANAFNNIFIKTVKDLSDGIVVPIIEDPLNRLMRWLSKPKENIPKLKLKSITLPELRKIIRNLKEKKSCGIDNIDGFSI